MKYIKITTIFIIPIVFIFLSSCNLNCVEPQGDIITDNIELDNFSEISISIPANVKIVTGDSAHISIKSYESYLAAIRTTVKRERLKLEGDICNASNDEVSIVITLPELSGISISGSADAYSDTPVRTDNMKLDISGSGKISLNVFANTIDSDISGSGDININGTCQELSVDIAGSGGFKGLGLNSYKAKVSIAGSGFASIVALNNLDAQVAGSGVINYSGEPEIKISISGSGKINKIN